MSKEHVLTKEYFDQAIQTLASKEYVDKAVQNVATKEYVHQTIQESFNILGAQITIINVKESDIFADEVKLDGREPEFLSFGEFLSNTELKKGIFNEKKH